MGISIYYNVNHHSLKCDYSPSISSRYLELGHIDGHNIMFIGYVPFKIVPISHKYPLKNFRKYVSLFFLYLSRKIYDYDISDRRSKYWYTWKK